ncbi:unknown [Prevotella sp. CAG:891]|nr:unknown [Prevotella sp. CAG:891]
MRVVIAGNPPCGVVACHCELAMLFFDNEVGQILLFGKFVAKSQSVVEESESNFDIAVVNRLRQRHAHFVVMIAYAAFFAPHGFPGFVEGRNFVSGFFESGLQVGFLRQF